MSEKDRKNGFDIFRNGPVLTWPKFVYEIVNGKLVIKKKGNEDGTVSQSEH